MVAHLAAANNFTIDHFNDEKNWALVQKAKIFYVTVSISILLKISNCDNNIIIINYNYIYLFDYLTY